MGRAIILNRYTKLSLTVYKSCCDITFGRFIYSLDICYSMYRRSCRRTGSINRKLVKNSANHYPKEVVETGMSLFYLCVSKKSKIFIPNYLIISKVITIVVINKTERPVIKKNSAVFSYFTLNLLLLLRIERNDKILLIIIEIVSIAVNSSIIDVCFNFKTLREV